MTEDKKNNYSGVWGNRVGFGERPALIVIDFMKAYTTEGSPLFAPGVIGAVQESAALLKVARDCNIPVIHTIVRYDPTNFQDGGIWIKKVPVLKCLVDGNPYAETCDQVLPIAGETVITKNYASAFFGTSLFTTLNAMGVDTVIQIGCSTSGCIRASAVDAVQYGFRSIVVRDCVGDRHEDPHEANLFDISSKYGDVVMKSEVIEYFKGLAA